MRITKADVATCAILPFLAVGSGPASCRANTIKRMRTNIFPLLLFFSYLPSPSPALFHVFCGSSANSHPSDECHRANKSATRDRSETGRKEGRKETMPILMCHQRILIVTLFRRYQRQGRGHRDFRKIGRVSKGEEQLDHRSFETLVT